MGRRRAFALSTTEFFMPILVTMVTSGLDEFVRFCTSPSILTT